MARERDPIGSVGLLLGRSGTPDVVGGRVLGYHAVNYIVRGGGVFRDADGAEEAVGPGSMFSLRPGVWHRFAPEAAWDEYYVTFDGAAVRRAFGDIIVGPPGHRQAPPDAALASAFEELHGLWLQRDRHYVVRSRHLLHQILLRFFDAWHGPAEVGDDLVAQALGLMRASLSAGRLDLRRFARERGVSYERFRKRFADRTGMSPHRCWLDMKLRQAGTLLRANRRSVREVAAAVGIDDPYYFSRLFTRHHGCPPQAYRRQ